VLQFLEYKRPDKSPDGGIKLTTEVLHKDKLFLISEVRNTLANEAMIFVVVRGTTDIDWTGVGGRFKDTDEAIAWLGNT
jgi:hypothetical protein